MTNNEQVVTRFYTAFQQKDFSTMQSCYHSQVRFTDPVFQNLNAAEVKAMWEMLLTGSKDLTLDFKDVHETGDTVTCTWNAYYTFSRTGRKVHNIISTSMKFRDGKIIDQTDRFDIWRWSRQALGFSGWLLGWTPVIANKVQGTARRGLDKFMLSKG